MSSPHLGGRTAIGLFIVTLLSFVIESQLTQYVQRTLGYSQPYFVFYIVHSSFIIIFPLHLLFLRVFSNVSTSDNLQSLSVAVSEHLGSTSDEQKPIFPIKEYTRLLLALTLGVSLPALLWFIAINMAPVTDVTAIWNANAFFAYILSVKVFKLQWEPRKLVAVVIATVGVLVLVYGGANPSAPESEDNTERGDGAAVNASSNPTSPVTGDLLTLVASVGYASYQVFYKKYAALPNDPELADTRGSTYSHIPSGDDVESTAESLPVGDLPFGLHPNLLTSTIGLFTMLLFWIPIPILHYLGAETFILPPNFYTAFVISGIAFSGVLFNAGFMTLLGLWGPIITSVSSLLTIVLVFVSDLMFGFQDTIGVWSLVGSGAIIAAFGMLAYDMFSVQ